MEEIRNFDIYKATNRLNNKYYIGVTTQGVGARMKKHLYKALSGSQYNFHKALAELGLEQFTVEVVDSTDDLEKAKELEKFWIEKLHSNNSEYGYNSDCGGDIMFHTDETKAKISAVHKGKDMSKFYNPVLQYSLNGKFICEYKSVTEAEEKSKISKASILRVIRKDIKTYSKVNPYIWVYKKDYPSTPLEIDPTDWKPKTRVRTVSENFLKRKANLKRAGKEFGSRIAPKAVIQYTKDNVFIAEFHSISEAVKQTGICANTITKYCNGSNDEKLKDPKFLKKIKYIWKYKE